MKALSVRPPWSWLLIRPDITDPKERALMAARYEFKNVENRPKPIPKSFTLPFRCAIHVSKTLDREGYNWCRRTFPLMGSIMPEPDEFERGGIIGTVDIIACVTEFKSPWFFGPYGYVIENPQPCKFIPWRGQLGFFEVSDDNLPSISSVCACHSSVW